MHLRFRLHFETVGSQKLVVSDPSMRLQYAVILGLRRQVEDVPAEAGILGRGMAQNVKVPNRPSEQGRGQDQADGEDHDHFLVDGELLLVF